MLFYIMVEDFFVRGIKNIFFVLLHFFLWSLINIKYNEIICMNVIGILI